jgi:hypothetical protein
VSCVPKRGMRPAAIDPKHAFLFGPGTEGMRHEQPSPPPEPELVIAAGPEGAA